MGHKYYRNRELSWIDFDKRVLEEAEDKENPLAERLSFESIFKKNLDEFFMVRIGALHDSVLYSKDPKDDKSKMRASEQIEAASARIRELCTECDKVYAGLMDEVKAQGINLVTFDELDAQQKKAADAYFKKEVFPLLAPHVVGKKHPFPFLNNKEIYAAADLYTKNDKEKIGIVSCTSGQKRLVPIDGSEDTFILSEELILHYIPYIFNKYKVKESAAIRILRNADIDTEEVYDDDKNCRKTMAHIIKKREKLCPIKMDVYPSLGKGTIKALCSGLKLDKAGVFTSASPLDFGFLSDIRDLLKGKDELFYAPRTPQKSRAVDGRRKMLDQLEGKDILLAYPYESMDPFLNMLSEAAKDPSVVSIKMTLYRVAKYSKVVESLIEAAENGKKVFVLVELRARFDEENNIEWATRLEDAGCDVRYGLDDYKVHSKLCLIERKVGDDIHYISQIGTGNYNEKTAKIYTDFCFMTAKQDIGQDLANVMEALEKGKPIDHTDHLLAAPKCLESKIFDMIDDEIKKAKQGKPAYIGTKVNGLTDKRVIDKLIEASQAGVKIDLVVRGICCIVPGIPGFTENIKVVSIVGRFLEHARIYIFGTAPDSRVFVGSADYMTRNLEHRVEVATPIYDSELKERVLHMFDIMMKDNVKGRIMLPDATFVKQPQDGNEKINSQEYFYDEAY